MNAKCVTVTRKGKFEVIIMIKSLVVLLLFALVIYAFLTFIYFVFDVLKWHDNEKKEDEKKEESANMKNGLNFARKVLATSECDLLVLDEILGVVDAGVISVEELCAIIRAKTEETDVILTGRRLPEELREIADEVYNIIAEK